MHETSPGTAPAQRTAPSTRSPVRRRRRLRAALIGIAVAAACAGAAIHLLPRAEAHFAANGPPGAEALSTPLLIRGRVTERLEAGRYVYLRIAEEGGPERWIVSIRPKAAQGDLVVARAAAHARDFESRRLRRTFEDLYFGSIEPAK